MKRVRTSMKKKVLDVSDGSDSEGKIIKRLKEKFHASMERSEKVQILTVLPKCWTIIKESSG